MTLRRQLFIGITLILLAVFCGVLFVTTSLSRAYLEQQLASHAQDSATALVHQLTQSLAQRDLTLAETQIATVFDRGYFQRIAVVSSSGQQLLSKELPEVIEGVPSWLPSLLRLQMQPGEALITAGWKQLGRVVVVSQPTLAYQHLWRNTQALAGLMVAAFVAALLLTQLFLSYVLTPLKRVEHAARAFCDKDFVQISPVPRTQELSRVVGAINDASQRISSMLDAEEMRAEGFRREAYSDSVTGLENRRSFDLRLGQVLSEEGIEGQLMVIEIDGLKTFNLEKGHRSGDGLLARFAEAARAALGSGCVIAARIGGGAFGFVLVGLPNEQAEFRATQILKFFAGSERDGAPALGVSLQIGIAPLRGGDKAGRLMANADLALERARQRGPNRWAMVSANEPESGPQGSLDWRQTIEEALANDRLVLFAQPVIELAGETVIHREIMARVTDRQGTMLHAASFIPMAQRHNFIVKIDREVIRLALDLLAKDEQSAARLAINLSPQSVEDREFCGWLTETLRAAGERASSLSFEVSEAAAVRNPAAVHDMKAALRQFGIPLGIDQFGLDPHALAAIRTISPDYVKLDGGLVQDAGHVADSRQVMASILQLAHSLDTKVIAQLVESKATVSWLREQGVDGAQGFYVGQPEPLVLEL